MRRVTETHKPGQVDGLSGWTEGPLPTQALEQAAFELFCDTHPGGLWAEPAYKAERDQTRRQVIRLYARFLTMERWTLSNMVDKIEAGLGQIVFGDRLPSPGEAAQLRDYSESCVEDLFSLFMGDQVAQRLAATFLKTRVQ